MHLPQRWSRLQAGRKKFIPGKTKQISNFSHLIYPGMMNNIYLLVSWFWNFIPKKYPDISMFSIPWVPDDLSPTDSWLVPMLDGLVNYTLPIKKVPSNRPLIPYWSPLIPHFVLMNSHSFPCFFPMFPNVFQLNCQAGHQELAGSAWTGASSWGLRLAGCGQP